jgi:glycosyltransferase involved in cell wall biosynthesis
MDSPIIAIDARYLRPPLSGIGRYTRNLLQGLAKADAVGGQQGGITVFISPDAGLPPEVRTAPNLNLVPIPGSPYSLSDQLRFPRILRQHKIRLLHTMDTFAPILPIKAKRIVTLYDVIPLACKNDMWRSKKAQFSFIWRKWLQMQVGMADAIITISRASAQDITRQLGVPEKFITVIPSGIAPHTPSSFDPGPPASNPSPYILYVGRRDPYKNIVRLIEAFALAAPSIPAPIQLVIAGAPDPRYMQPEAAAQRLAIADRVQFLGHVSDAQLASLYAHASLFVFPSLYEGQGLPPLEAMQAGVPVIASNRAAIPEAVGDAALLIDPANVTQIAAAIQQVLTTPELAASLVSRGRARAAQFTVERQAQATLDLYSRMLQHA